MNAIRPYTDYFYALGWSRVKQTTSWRQDFFACGEFNPDAYKKYLRNIVNKDYKYF
jgi:hypothetical protein